MKIKERLIKLLRKHKKLELLCRGRFEGPIYRRRALTLGKPTRFYTYVEGWRTSCFEYVINPSYTATAIVTRMLDYKSYSDVVSVTGPRGETLYKKRTRSSSAKGRK